MDPEVHFWQRDVSLCRESLTPSRFALMSLQDELLAAVAADPDNDLPRLVYADWLASQPGDADRALAEFIRLQCENERRVGRRAYYRPLDDQERGLLEEYRDQWLGKATDLEEDFNIFWNRGFPERAHARIGMRPKMLASLPTLPTLRDLGLFSCSILDRHCRALAQNRFLEVLDLNGTQVGDEGLAELISLPLTELFLAWTAVTGEGLLRLSEFTTLQRVWLGQTQFERWADEIALLRQRRPGLAVESH